MHQFRLFAVAILALVSLSALPAETVTVTVIQNESAPAIAETMSRTIEDELFGDFFDAGHIVSNTGIRFDGKNFADAGFGVSDAASGLSDYLVAVLLEYSPGEKKDAEKKSSWAELVSLEWRVVKVSDSTTLGQKKIDVTKIKVIDIDPYNQSRIVADLVSDQTLDAIAKAKQREKNK